MKTEENALSELAMLLKIYYGKPNEIGNSELKHVFNRSSGTTIGKRKKEIRKLMDERDIKVRDANNVDTQTAYEVAKIDINVIEKNYLRLKKLGLEGA